MYSNIAKAHSLMVRRYFSSQNDNFALEGPFESEEEALRHWPPNDTEYVRVISVLIPLGAKVEVDYWEMSTYIDQDTLQRTWDFKEEEV